MKTMFFFLLSFSLWQNVFAQWSDGQSAEYVIGQPDFTTYSSGSATNQFNSPRGAAIDYTNNKLYIADLYNNRVFRFSYPISGNQPAPERVFGTGSDIHAQNTLPYPISVAVYDGALWVVNEKRIVKFNSAHSASSDGPNADVVLGQTNFTNTSSSTTQSTFVEPTDIVIDDTGNMWVVDFGSNRVLKFNDVNNLSNGADADLVLGQSNFTNNSVETTQSGMSSPFGITISGLTLWVADQQNNRVLRFNSPSSNGQNASGVLGQSDFTSNASGLSISAFSYPTDVTIDAAGRLYVSDNENGRVMIFNDAANKSDGGNADNVIGQTNFTSRAATRGGSSNFYYISEEEEAWRVGSVTVDPTNNKLLVSDERNHRVMIFSASSSLPVELTSFTSSVNGNTVVLTWQTATEANNYGFEIERASVELNEGMDEWNNIGFVEGHGNSYSPKSYAFIDNDPPAGNLKYRLKQIDLDGSYEYYGTIAEVTFGVTEIGEELLPTEFALYQNYPNPFNPATRIRYSIPAGEEYFGFMQFVSLKIYDILGNEVAVVVNEEKAPGNYEVEFNASNLASGMYIYQLNAGELREMKKAVLVK